MFLSEARNISSIQGLAGERFLVHQPLYGVVVLQLLNPIIVNFPTNELNILGGNDIVEADSCNTFDLNIMKLILQLSYYKLNSERNLENIQMVHNDIKTEM